MKVTFHFPGLQSEVFLGVSREKSAVIAQALAQESASIEFPVLGNSGLGREMKKIINLRNVLFITIEEE